MIFVMLYIIYVMSLLWNVHLGSNADLEKNLGGGPYVTRAPIIDNFLKSKKSKKRQGEGPLKFEGLYLYYLKSI